MAERDTVLFVDNSGKLPAGFSERGASQSAPMAEDTAAHVGSRDGASQTTPGGREEVQPASAINEETGEINWDCPCLKSALAPPCGEFFKEAFSCFAASKSEPKGADCLDKFSAMQDCFRAHPEVYMRSSDGDDAARDDEAHQGDGSSGER